MRRGFTLIELLAAMAILAVVSVMAVQALGGAFFQRDILVRHDNEAARVIRALTLLRHDFEAALAMPATDPPRAGQQFGLTFEAGGVEFLRAGIADIPGGASGGIGAVSWRVQGGRLMRRLVRDMLDRGRTAPDMPMLDGVRAIRVAPLGLADGAEPDPDTLPPGFEVTLETDAHGPLRLVVAR